MPSIEWNRRAWPEQFAGHDSGKALYGYEWGDPNTRDILVKVRDRFIFPYVDPERSALEIGPGGGRWTQFLVQFRKLYLIDLNDCFFESLKRRYPAEHVVCTRTSGSDLPDIDDDSLHYVFSFGTFVHIDPVDIDGYLGSIKRKLAPEGMVVLHYSDKTKPLGMQESAFSYNSPDLMRSLVGNHGFSIHEEDLGTLPHSSLIRFGHARG